MVFVLIIAGGIGSRMGKTNMPKQFLNLAGKPIIIHTIEKFYINKKINKIIVSIKKEWFSFFIKLLNKYSLDNKRVIVAEAGKTRHETVINGNKFICKNFNITQNDIVLIHDAVRPFISEKIINNHLEKIKKCDAVCTALSLEDSILYSKNGVNITNVPERKYYYREQSPQTFRIKELLDLNSTLTTKEKELLTDDTKIYTINNKKIEIVEGEKQNFKITTAFDLVLAEKILYN